MNLQPPTYILSCGLCFLLPVVSHNRQGTSRTSKATPASRPAKNTVLVTPVDDHPKSVLPADRRGEWKVNS